MLLLVLYGAVKRKGSEDKVPNFHIYFVKKMLMPLAIQLLRVAKWLFRADVLTGNTPGVITAIMFSM
jgi:hypothetical protein